MRILVLAMLALVACVDAPEATRTDPVVGVGSGSCCCDAPPPVTGPNRAFVTSVKYAADFKLGPQNFGGLNDADLLCRQHAANAGLHGTFVAMLWNAGTSPASRVAASRGWIDLTNKPIVDRPEGWLPGGGLFPLRVNEFGQTIPTDAPLWIGSNDSIASRRDCSAWSTRDPDTRAGVGTTRTGASNHELATCDGLRAIICAETGRVWPVAAPTVTTGRLAFISTTTWQPGAGLGAADAVCQHEAAIWNRPGTYKAYLGTQAVPPWGRFSAIGGPWRRLDGIPLTATANDFLIGATYFDTYLGRGPDHPYYQNAVWTGYQQTCGDWTVTTGAGAIGWTDSSVRNDLVLGGTASCSNKLALLCLQE